MTTKSTLIILAAGVILIAGIAGDCEKNTDCATESSVRAKSKLIIFNAGSLSVPFSQISAIFERAHPGVKVLAESAGSRDCARKISDLGRQCDVFGSADYKVVTNLLMPEHTKFNIRFASNEMVMAYTDRSAKASQITAGNWPSIFMSDGVLFGRSEPNRDPCGYRAIMLLQLAEEHYGIDGLAEKLIEKSSGKYVRPKETELLALLEAGEIDYIVIYRSVAIQHGLKILDLPAEINLGSPAFTEHYKTAVVKVTGAKPGEFIERQGEPMVYSVTIPRNAPNREMAEAWVELLLSARGRGVMIDNGQPCLTPARVDQLDALPQSLRQYCAEQVGEPIVETQL